MGAKVGRVGKAKSSPSRGFHTVEGDRANKDVCHVAVVDYQHLHMKISTFHTSTCSLRRLSKKKQTHGWQRVRYVSPGDQELDEDEVLSRVT